VGWMLQVFSAVGQVGEAPGVFARYHPKTLGTLVTQDSEPAGKEVNQAFIYGDLRSLMNH